MASGTRSIVWRSDIDAGRERPAFFFCAAKRNGRTQLVGQLAGRLSRAQLTQLIPAFLGGKGGRKEEEGKKKEEVGEEGGEGDYLFNK